jgi:glycosyltransferase involved in cell wall biosynthesis
MKTLLLTPSDGLGGGIERYVHTLRMALVDSGEHVVSVALTTGPAPSLRWGTKARFAARSVRAAAQTRSEVVMAMHPGLLPVLLVVRLVSPRARFVLFFYGTDIWGGIAVWERWVLKRWRRLGLATISNYSAGAVSMLGRDPDVLMPALDRVWHAQLVQASRPHAERDLDLLSVFRLADWETKGVPDFLEVVERLSRSRPTKAAIAGKGPVPAPLLAACRGAGVEVLSDLTEAELAALYGRTRVFLLATVLTTGHRASGEGFGIVLLEAQAAGAAVVAPRSGGSSDAYLSGVTGWRQPRRTDDLVELLEDLRARDVSKDAQSFVARRFSQDRLQAELTELLHGHE